MGSRTYRYPDALILVILAVKGYIGLPVLQAEGFARMLGGKRGEDTHMHPDMQEAEGVRYTPRREI